LTKVLVTGAGALLGQGIIKSLQRAGTEYEIVAVDPSPLSPGLFWAHRGYTVPLATDSNFVRAIEQFLEREHPDIVLVGTDVELPVFAQERDRLEAEFSTTILVSPPDVVRIADDKYETFVFLNDAELNPPASALPESDGQLQRLIDSVGFPLVVKPRVGARSAGVSLVNDEGELRHALVGRGGLVVQELAGDATDEYTSSVLVFDGAPTASIVMRRDLRDGNTHRAYAESFPELNEFVRNVAARLQPFGPVNFQFRTDRQGSPRIFEINARFSGATPLRALVGFNEVDLCIRHLLFGEPAVGPQKIREGVILRPLGEQFVSKEQIAGLHS